jgi:DNA-binding CsgD family transcriptional regulator
MTDAASLLDCLSAGYRLDLDDAAYVENLTAEAARLMDRGLGVLVYTYDASDFSNPIIDHQGTSDAFDPSWLPRYHAALTELGESDDPTKPTGFAAWGTMTCGQASQVPGMRRYLPAFAHIGGARDTFAVNALDASGRGLWLGAPMLDTTKVDAETKLLYSRLAAHLTAAVRLRRTRAPNAPAAVMSVDGKLLHAHDHATSEAKDELARATRAFEHARTRAARHDVERTTRRWRPLVESTWTLLDEFDRDGRRFIVAVDNRPPTAAPRGALSEREHQVLTHAVLGHTNKEIAYELGISDATVRVLVHRAARKLGVTTRSEAVARFGDVGDGFAR